MLRLLIYIDIIILSVQEVIGNIKQIQEVRDENKHGEQHFDNIP